MLLTIVLVNWSEAWMKKDWKVRDKIPNRGVQIDIWHRTQSKNFVFTLHQKASIMEEARTMK